VAHKAHPRPLPVLTLLFAQEFGGASERGNRTFLYPRPLAAKQAFDERAQEALRSGRYENLAYAAIPIYENEYRIVRKSLEIAVTGGGETILKETISNTAE
jgi:hypothetical protein